MDSQPHTSAPIPPPPQLNMDKLLEQLFERTERLEKAVQECHANHLKPFEFQNGALVRALEQNTRVLQNIENNMSKWPKGKRKITI